MSDSNIDARQSLAEAHALSRRGRFSDAVVRVSAVLKSDPHNREAQSLRGFSLLFGGKFREALEAADRLVDLGPSVPEGYALRSLALRKLKRPTEAVASCERLVGLAPQSHLAHTAFAEALREAGRIEEAEEQYRIGYNLGARRLAHFQGWGDCLMKMPGRVGDADKVYAAIYQSWPDDHEAHYGQALGWLALGDFQRGWPEHEWRLRAPDHASHKFETIAPRWRGQTLAGKRLLVHAEQGNGDVVQFTRYLSLLLGQGAAVTLQVDRPIRGLIADSFPAVSVVKDLDQRRSAFDLQIPLLSLPLQFGTTVESTPATVPYIKTDPERVAKWRRRIGDAGLRVGIAWQGNTSYSSDADRSIPLAMFAPLAQLPGVRLISLQACGGLDQFRGLPPGLTVERLGNEIEDNPDGFREVAAAMANCDLVIASDSAPAHLAGALGRPVWLPLTRYADWRWMREGETSPWYPTMRLLRQERHGDWAGVFERIAAALSPLAAGAASPELADAPRKV